MNGETKLRLPALNINAVDATGAGDNFAAGFTAEILNGNVIMKLLFLLPAAVPCAQRQ